MFEEYGHKRIADGENTLPIMAWKMDACKEADDGEMILQVEKIHVERNSLKQMIFSVGRDEEKVKERIMSIVNDRGKLHNPFTGTGGTIYGRVSRIGRNFKHQVEIGEMVLVTTSATMVPLCLKRIKSIDFIYGSMEVEGYCILFNSYNFVRQPEMSSLETLLLGFEESPAIYHAYELAKGNKNFLITGNNLIIALTYALAVKKATDGDCTLTGLLYPDLDAPLNKEEILPYYEEILDTVYIIEPEEVLSQGGKIITEQLDEFDFCINCSDVSESEIIDVLALKNYGTLFYTNVMSTYQTALFFSEGIRKAIDIVGPLGYVEGYEDFTVSFMIEVNDQIAAFADKLRTVEKKSAENYRALRNQAAKKKMSEIADIYGLVYLSDKMNDVVASAVNLAKYDCPVLITGETGVGKEKIAKLLHSLSKRRLGPYLCVNCGAVPSNLMEMEFFGYERGAFTGASPNGKKGYFETAANGVLFLDEIGELEPILQSKLLRVLQEKEFYRIGGNVPIHSNARIIASTNRDLKSMAARGQFREDLYYRIKVASVHVPPLRQRKEDVAPIAEFFLAEYNESFEMDKLLDSQAMALLETYGWPGNVRELENMIQRLMINSSSEIITAAHVESELRSEMHYEESQKKLTGGSLKVRVMMGNALTA